MIQFFLVNKNLKEHKMSEKKETIFAVKFMNIMEKVLTKMGYTLNSSDKTKIFTRCHLGYQITITEKGISYDSSSQREVDQIKLNYSKAVAMNSIETAGLLYTVEENADEIIYLVKG
jgi:hypothetical protein